jgi:hypothetical protein
MKNMHTIIAISSMLLASCGSSTNLSEGKGKSDSTTQQSQAAAESKTITGKIALLKPVKLGEAINLHFTVVNNLDSAASFCKWHTPFEPLMSKYLDVTAEDGTAVDYQGAMAKRMMPPPASSYVKLNPKDSTAVDFDLAKAYAIRKAGKYTIKYNAAEISGVIVPDSLVIVVGN